MLKKYLLPFLLLLCTNCLGMEEPDDEPNYEKSQEKEFQLDLNRLKSKRNSFTFDSPRNSINLDCPLLRLLPDEMLLLIIDKILESDDISQANKPGLFAFLAFDNKPKNHILQRLKKIHNVVFSFRLSAKTIHVLAREALRIFCLAELAPYERAKKIEFAQESYAQNDLPIFGLILTSILQDLKKPFLNHSNKIINKATSKGMLSIKDLSLIFTPSEIEFENLELIEILRELHSAEDNFVNIDAIFKIALISRKELLKILVNIENLPNSYISTNLMLKAFNGDLDYFQNAQRENEAELYDENGGKFTPIIWAIIGGNNTLLNYIFSTIPVEQLIRANMSNENILHLSALYADSETLQFLLSKLDEINLTALINAKDQNNHSPLSRAIESGSENKTLMLLNVGAQIDILNVCNSICYEGPSKMLQKLTSNSSLSPYISEELEKLKLQDGISPEIVIQSCEKAKNAKRSLANTLYTLFGIIICLIIYKES